MLDQDMFDVVIVGGGPSGATAATDLAKLGRRVLLLDKAGRIKPCGGAIPPAAIAEFNIPDDMLVAKVTCARMVSPKGVEVDMPINGGFVGMVDREQFDEWLRARAAMVGAKRVTGTFDRITRDSAGYAIVHYHSDDEMVHDNAVRSEDKKQHMVRTRLVIGADGASSKVARQEINAAADTNYVYAYHEIVSAPAAANDSKFDPKRCDVYYQGQVSPDFYGWVFPHGDTVSVGMGTAEKGFSIRNATADLRVKAGLANTQTVRREGAPIPMKPLSCWDNGKDVVLAGDAAGVVAPASGEGIYYAMLGGRLAGEAAQEFLTTNNARALAGARKRFMKAHGRVFWILGMMQRFWYSSDKRRERFVSICRDKDVQDLTWQAYMHKKLVRAKPMAHIRIFFKDLAHLTGLARL
jgi:geranylgeranyl diphosphate/geranylgeranyl-bacteriochlorophyllide a reductase